MPPLERIEQWLVEAGLSVEERRVVSRNQRLELVSEERALAIELPGRYAFISAAEAADGLRRMRADATANDDSWVDPRPTHFLVASKPRQS